MTFFLGFIIIMIATMSTRVVPKCDLIPPVSTLTETSILYTGGHKDTRTDGRKDRVIPVYPRKHSFCGGIMITTSTFTYIKYGS